MIGLSSLTLTVVQCIMRSLLFIYFASLGILGGSPDKYSHRCTSLDAHWNQVVGQCVNFLICPRLLEFAKRPGKSMEDFGILKRLTCGFREDKPKICCPLEDILHPPKRDLSDYNRFPLHFPDEDRRDEDLHESYDDPLPMLIPVPFYSPPISAVHIGEDYYQNPVNSYKLEREIWGEGLIPKLESCGEPKQDFSTSTRIIGGTRAYTGQFPYMALLFRIDSESDDEEQYCAGTIINQFYVLTAAHCILTNQNTSDLLAFIQVGITDVTERCQQNGQRECRHDKRYEVEKTIVHPKYVYGSRDRSHDIALIRVRKKIEFDEKYIRPVCLPYPKYGLVELVETERSSLNSDGMGIVAGFGRENNSGPQSSTNLKFTMLPILTRSDCQRRYGTQVKISEGQLCAGGNIGRDTCIGDSGGPILIPLPIGQGKLSGKMFQTGIISFGPALCGSTGKPSVYTRVATYIDWILDNMHL